MNYLGSVPVAVFINSQVYHSPGKGGGILFPTTQPGPWNAVIYNIGKMAKITIFWCPEIIVPKNIMANE